MDPDRLGPIIHEAFHIATHGRPGPVVIDIPKNVQVATGTYSVPELIEHHSYRPQVEPDADAIAAAIDLIAAAERPIFYTGGGVINAGPDASAALRQRSEEHTSELQSLMRSSYAVFCLKKNNTIKKHTTLRYSNTKTNSNQ